MNNAKMWLVVPPAVGIPVFLGAVAVGSLAVHVAVLSKVSWYNDYVAGQPLGTGDALAAAALKKKAEDGVAQASYTLPRENGAQELTVILPDGTTARAILQPDVLAASSPPLLPAN